MNYLVHESLEDYMLFEETTESDELDLDDPSLQAFTQKLGMAIATETEKKIQTAKSEKTNESLNEGALTIGALVLSGILASPVIIKGLGSLVSFFAKKLKAKSWEQKAESMKKFADKFHHILRSPIEKILGKFGFDEKKINIGTDIIFLIILISLGAVSAIGASQALQTGKSVLGATESSLVAIKSKEALDIINRVVHITKV